MIGLIGTALQLASQIVPEKKVVMDEISYKPNITSFGDAGLYNNSVADLGEIRGEKTIIDNSLSEGLAGLGGAITTVGAFGSGIKNALTNKDKKGAVNTVLPPGKESTSLGSSIVGSTTRNLEMMQYVKSLQKNPSLNEVSADVRSRNNISQYLR